MAKNKFWNFTKNQATENTSENIDLRIEGDIISSDDSWIYEWLGIPCATPNAFRDELSQFKSKNINVWINSNGGDVFAGAGIYNALKEHDGKVTVKIEKAMSAASVIAMAGDEILMSPVAIFMMHNPLSAVQGYASEMRKQADVLDTVKECIMNAYCEKTNKSREEISSMMDDETYMDANTAVKKGFVDGVLYIENKETKNVMNFAFNRLSIQNCANESIKHLFALENKNNIPPIREEKDMDIKNAQELKTQLPAIHDEILNAGNAAGVVSERARLKAFDVLNGKVDADYLAKAKEDDTATAESTLFKAMQEGKMINAAYVDQAAIDAAAANQVAGASTDNNKPDEVTGVLNVVANIAKKTLGIKEGGK
jgi:ATP-dependent Clp endopeptidase proteolytic subunit ClpP